MGKRRHRWKSKKKKQADLKPLLELSCCVHDSSLTIYTMLAWCRQGRRGYRLKHIQHGGRVFSTERWLIDFLDKSAYYEGEDEIARLHNGAQSMGL